MEEALFAAGTVVLPAALAAAALFFLCYLKGAPFRRTPKDKKRASPAPLLMALAGTLGVGNVTGVADAVLRGGPGVLFWMWLSSLFAMTVKFVEVALLSAEKRRLFARLPADAPVGPMIYMRPVGAGILFSLLGLLCGFTVGSGLQSTAVYKTAECFFGIPPVFVCLPLGLAALFFILRKKTQLFAVTSVLVPLLTCLYAGMCLAVILSHAAMLPGIFRKIVKSAFGADAALHGGAAGMLTALRCGVVRGLLSNEAGCGTAPIAHAHGAASPFRQAKMGMLEVAVDTLLLCSLTGLSLLTLDPLPQVGPAEAVGRALSGVFGAFSGAILTAALAVFAFATLLCWSVYIDCFVSYLFARSPRRKVYVSLIGTAFCSFCCFSFLVPEELLWRLSDASVCAMTLMNLCFLILRRRRVKEALPIP